MADRPMITRVSDDGRELVVVLTHADLLDIVARATGRPADESTHWVRASVELPPGYVPPLGITVTATRR